MLERLRSALADRYRLERELGQGGMATVPTRPSNRNTGNVRGGRAWFTIEDQRSDIWVMEITR